MQTVIALRARTQLRGYLVGLGAVERPPMPELIVEAHGGAPFDGAVWLEGHWTWSGARWAWTHGGWKDPGRFSETGGGEIAVVVAPPTPVVVEAPTPVIVVATPPAPTIAITPVVIPPIPTIVIGAHPTAPHRPPPAPRAPRKDPVVRDHRR